MLFRKGYHHGPKNPQGPPAPIPMECPKPRLLITPLTLRHRFDS